MTISRPRMILAAAALALLAVANLPADGAIAARLVDGKTLKARSVTAAKLASNSVTSRALAKPAVTAAKLAPGAIGTAALAKGAVTAAKLAPGAVGSAPLASIASATASCPPGTRAFSGGVTIDDASTLIPVSALRQSAPVADANGTPVGWVGTVANTANLGGAFTFHVLAICG